MEIIGIEACTFETMMECFEEFSQRVISLCDKQDKSLKKWLDNQDVCRILSITKRTLQSYRDSGMLPYTQIGHKIYYSPEDVENFINRVKVK